MNSQDKGKLSLRIEDSILNELDSSKLEVALQALAEVFKKDYEKYFSVDISSVNEALYLTHLGLAMSRIGFVDGFEKHIKEYRNDVNSTHFVTVLADYLLPLTDSLELEPSFDLHPKCPDIKIQFNGRPLYIECKNPKKNILDDLKEEQQYMYKALSDVVLKHPCNLTVTYDERISEKELTKLVAILKERLESVSGEGNIYDNSGVQVAVTSVGKLGADIGEESFSFILEDRHSERNLINIISINGVAISFVKRSISVLDNITSQFKKCTNKVPKTESLILAIQSEYLTGHPRENSRIISGLFQPKKFTSINGVLLSSWDYSAENEIENSFIYINNPYARNPVSDFERLFRKDAETTLYAKI